MPDYRLYFLDLAGHIRGVVELACADDDEATQRARLYGDGRPMELWNRERPVRTFTGDEGPPP